MNSRAVAELMLHLCHGHVEAQGQNALTYRSQLKAGVMGSENEDMEAFGLALQEMEHLQLFRRTGAHAKSWAAMRSAAHQHSLTAECTWPNCSATPVGSHTIAKGSGLAPLAVGGHVMMPRPIPRPTTMVDRGLQHQATVYPGYCKEHEQRFGTFERLGVLTSNEHVALQLFRSASREIWNKRRWLDYFDTLQRQYAEVLIEKPVQEVPPGLADRVLRPLEDQMRRTYDEIVLLAAVWQLCWAVSGIEGTPQVDAHPEGIRRIHIATSRRIALSGSTFVAVHGPAIDPYDRLPVVLAMLPTADGVDCMFATIPAVADEYEANMLLKIKQRGGDHVVDEWLTSTEWWCADPGWWETTDPVWRRAILERLDAV
jgi:hypothetical protein